MKTVTMLEFRRYAGRMLAALRRGERLVLTYRGKPVARLEPVREGGSPPSEDDALLHIGDFTIDGPGGALTNHAIDRTVYGA